MLAGIDLLLGQCLTRVDLGQATILVVTVFSRFAFFALIGIGGNKAIEADDRADGAQASLLALVVRQDLNRRALDFGGCHLAGDAALPDEVVEPQLVGVEEAAQLVR